MIVHRLAVANWKCFIERVEVGPFTERINVLHAPNATGKTSLFQALVRGLLDGHRTRGQQVEDLRPRGRGLAPSVTVEFTQSGTRWRIWKQFLDTPGSLLERFEGGRFVAFAEGEAADRETREMLSRNPPGRGLSKQEHWGIAQILWAPQGELGYQELTGDLVDDIRSALGAQLSGGGEEPLQKRVEEAYFQYYTAGGRLRTGRGGAELLRLSEERGQAADALAEVLERQTQFEEAARSVEDLRARRDQARREAESIGASLQKAREEAKSYRAILSEIEQQRERVEGASARHKELETRIEVIRNARNDLEALETKLANLREEIPEREKEVVARESEAAAAKAKLEDIRHGRSLVERAEGRAEQARVYSETLESLAMLDGTIEKVLGLQRELSETRSSNAEVLAPDAGRLREIRETAEALRDLNVRIESALISVELVPREDRGIQLLEAEETGEKTLTGGIPFEAKGSPAVVIDLEGFGRIRARGPIQSVEEFREKRTDAERRLADLTRPFGTTDFKTLETLFESREKIEKRASEIEAQLTAQLSGRSVEGLKTEKSRLEAIREDLLQQEADWRENPPDWEEFREEAARVRRDFIREVETAEAERDSKQNALAIAASVKNSLSERTGEIEQQIASTSQRLEELTRDGAALEERERLKREAALAWEAARERLRQAEETLHRFEGNPIELVETLERRIEAADRTATEALEREKQQEGRLQQLCAEGTYTALAQAEERLQDLDLRIQREEDRMAALKLLYDTLRENHDRAMEAVLKPVADLASRSLERIAGSRFGRLRLGESFEPKTIVPRALEGEIPLDQLSGGETEQVFLATRLALAETLAQEERQLVVLDDILTSTDSGRLARIMNLLEEAADKLQILILTCHPERYGGLEAAEFIDLEKAIEAARSVSVDSLDSRSSRE